MRERRRTILLVKAVLHSTLGNCLPRWLVDWFLNGAARLAQPKSWPSSKPTWSRPCSVIGRHARR